MRLYVCWTIFLAFICTGSFASLLTTRYDNHKVVKIPMSSISFRFIEKLGLDLFGNFEQHWILHVNLEQFDDLKRSNISFVVLNENLQKSIDQEHFLLDEARLRKNADWFDSYHPYEDIKAWYKAFSVSHPALVTFLPSVGVSHEYRDIFAVRLSAGAAHPKPQVFIQGQIHAREWISGSTVGFIFDSLIKDYGVDANVTRLLDELEFNFIPLLNVDGYVYTWTTDRLWRKNRRVPPLDSNCYGIDLNRNYNDHWAETGSSSDPCSNNYHGIYAASEPEVATSQRFFKSLGNVIGSIDFHSSGQLILRPYGWSYTDAPDEAVHSRVGSEMAAAILAESGFVYTSQKSVGLYPTSGSAVDWFYGEDASSAQNRRSYGFTIELRPNTGGQHDIPPDQIVPTGKENYAAVKRFAAFVLENQLGHFP